jgi:hypothetical protein
VAFPVKLFFSFHFLNNQTDLQKEKHETDEDFFDGFLDLWISNG